MATFNRDVALTNASNDLAFLRELAGMFVEDAAVELDGLRQALTDGAAEQLRFHAHTLKGMAGNLGGEDLHTICKAMEESGKRADLAQAARDLPQLQEALSAFCTALQQA